MDGARAARRRLPAGDQGVARSDPDGALRDGRLLVLLARREGLLGRRPARQSGDLCPSGRRSTHPAFDYENRIVMVGCRRSRVASVYVPNGGKDFPAKMRFLAALEQFAADAARGAAADGDLRRPQHRAHRHGRAPEGTQAARDRPAARRARTARADHRPRPGRRRPRAAIRTTTRCSRGGRRGGTCASATSAGASTTSWRASRCSNASELRRPARSRHQRPRAGHCGVQALAPAHLSTCAPEILTSTNYLLNT